MILGPFILIHVTYLVAVLKNNFSVIDIIWGLGFVVLGAIGCNLSSWDNSRENLLFTLILIWGLRLSTFLLIRNTGKKEDFRYAQWRKQWGDQANRIAYFKVFLLQFMLMLIVGLPIFAVHEGKQSALSLLDYLGIFIWMLGLGFEAVADHQKSVFKSKPENKNKICQGGLWHLSRHPNYFGEALLWWGLGIISINTNQYWGLLGPLLINFLLLKISGVPLLEKRYENNKEYEAYKKITPRFIPSISKVFKSSLYTSP